MRLLHFILLSALAVPAVSVAAEEATDAKKKPRWTSSNTAPQPTAAPASTPAPASAPATPAPKANTKKTTAEDDPSCD